MDFRENKVEFAMLLCGALVIFGLFRLFGGLGEAPMVTDKAVNYEMPRPKSDLVADFDLEGREIERRHVNPFDKKKAEVKKAEEAKKTAAVAAKAPSQAKKAEATKDADKKNDVDVNVVGNDPQRQLGGGDSATSPQQVRLSTRETAGAPASDVEDKDKLSPDQWRALVLGAPTRENVNKLVAALAAGEVDQNIFFGIVEDLMESQKSESQSLALFALRSVVTARSFALVVHSMDRLSPSVKTAANEYLAQFTQAGRLGALAQVLQTSDVVVATKAVEVLMTGLAQARSGGGVTTDPRQARGEVQAASLESFARFIPIFQRWKQSGDSQLVSLANNALAQLQTSAS